jgi:tRNA-dihydrouridine synthase B
LILGNGDLRDMQDAYQRVRQTNVDGVLLGRAAQGNPWVFRVKEQVKQALSSNGDISIDSKPITLEERLRVLLEHSKHFDKHWGTRRFVGMRKHLAWYCHGSPRAAELRSRMVEVNNINEVIDCLGSYVRSIASIEHAFLNSTSQSYSLGGNPGQLLL